MICRKDLLETSCETREKAFHECIQLNALISLFRSRASLLPGHLQHVTLYLKTELGLTQTCQGRY